MALSSVRRISTAGTIAILAIALAIAPGVSPAAIQDISVDFGWSPTTPTPGQVVTFTAAATPPGGVAIKSYGWDLNGDGSIDKHGATATWSYPAPGLRQRAAAREGQQEPPRRRCAHGVGPGRGAVVARPRPPVASFTIAPAAPVANQPVVFTSASSDPDGTLTEQVWDLNGDGNYDNGGGVTALRSFADAGSYVIGLRVMDDAGLVSFDSHTVTVLPAPGTLPITTQESGLRLLSPFPVVRMTGRITGRGTRVRLLRVKRTRADDDHDPLYRSQLPLQEAGAGGPGGRQRANGSQRPRSAPRAAAAPRRPGACLRHEARRGGEVHEVSVPRRQRATAHRPLRDAGIIGTG